MAGVGSRSLAKGWLSLGLGLMLGTIGGDPVAATPRYTFGTLYLTGGIGFIPLILGLFAVSEVFIQGQRMVRGTYKSPELSVSYPSFAEFWSLKWAVARSTVIGWFSGILPGVGATLAAFLSYNEAVRWSKTPERFGTGVPEGVVAPETANNAATGAAMIPLLALGLPGGALTAMMIGVFNLHDMEVGPLIMVEAPELVWILFASMFWASLAILVLGMVEAKGIVHLLRIPFSMLAPGILVFSTIGAYALRGNIFDVYIMFVAGVVGYFLRRSDYSVPAIVMGVILGQIGENSMSPGAHHSRLQLPRLLRRAGLGRLLHAWLAHHPLGRSPAGTAVLFALAGREFQRLTKRRRRNCRVRQANVSPATMALSPDPIRPAGTGNRSPPSGP